MSGLLGNDKNKQEDGLGVTGAAKTGTGILGNTVSGLTNTLGGVVGGASRGVGETVNAVTGDVGKPLGDGVSNVGTSVEGTGQDIAQSARDAGQWKTN
ncbi:hypothetical protein KVR01_000257 [Diaporthe batatas]|uniref:uncharacterized protein n=1 Tax=Diaporthe batatas TaxID=748121 RepID=UPI001D041DDB|nr:uncharacterized protein KVR01_000257 [Diaporthe batatas]KAG8169512.1 hypothetical protein KVR01_000257 [Diaporthe batatas]